MDLITTASGMVQWYSVTSTQLCETLGKIKVENHCSHFLRKTMKPAERG